MAIVAGDLPGAEPNPFIDLVMCGIYVHALLNEQGTERTSIHQDNSNKQEPSHPMGK